jgi:tetratricopeptide (TPR) repeat protein
LENSAPVAPEIDLTTFNVQFGEGNRFPSVGEQRMSGVFVLVVGLLAVSAGADHPPARPIKPAVLMPGLGRHHHPVSTKNEQAQRFFDQGLTLLFAFNHDHAVRSFRRAAELDPDLAMAQWGIALALGPNYNLPQIEPDQAKTAYDALQKALVLSTRAPAEERAYVEALAKRYSTDPAADRQNLALEYKNAMGDVSRQFPDDLDAATLYAESAMNLRPWKLWNADGTPAEGTAEIVAVLEEVLRRNPEHPGANHYYIHAVEASRNPERALPSADRLASLAPGAGHLVHMPSHIYFRVGAYEAAARSNEKAVAVDRAFVKATGATGIYPMMYLSHNLHFVAAARGMQGRFQDAKQAADDLAAHVGPHVAAMPMLEAWMPLPLEILVYFRRWDEILALPRPAESLPITGALWHFSRAAAFSDRGNLAGAETEQRAFLAAKAAIPAETLFSETNTAQTVLEVVEKVLAARLALARKETAEAIALYTDAVRLEDALSYGEPPDGFLRARESLGGVLLRAEKFAEAEQVFRADLAKFPRNGRSLFGLRESLKGQKKDRGAHFVHLEFEAAWKRADPKELSVDDL